MRLYSSSEIATFYDEARRTSHSANLALFANYLAASFPTVVGNGGLLLTDALDQASQLPLLTHQRAG